MRRSTRIERTAIQAVARHFSAPLEQGEGPGDACLIMAGKRIAVLASAIESRAARRAKVTRPRLRFDRVALGLIARLRTALYGAVPDRRTVIVTITAPIRVPSKTTIALEEKIRKLVATRAAPARLRDTIHGNEIQIHLLKGGTDRTAKLIGFVHNPDSDPTILIDVTRSLLARIGSGERTANGRWLVIATEDGSVLVETCRQVCAQLGVRSAFAQTLVVLRSGQIVTLRA